MDKFVSKCFTEGFNIKKYGLIGDDKTPNIVETEVIKEIRIEVPVEVIKEVETIKEVEVIKYVDREVVKEIIKEVPVTNLDNICDKPEPNIVEKIVEVEKPNDKMKLLQETLQKLRKEISDKNSRIQELETINKNLESIKVSQGAVFLKGSNISDTL